MEKIECGVMSLIYLTVFTATLGDLHYQIMHTSYLNGYFQLHI